ncbi:hypothetical protein C8R43DRAFT_1136663 [Mycena crocata]|nr:hypothetical protein C8R43DRAFT_1136663 [Mycena crocata]
MTNTENLANQARRPPNSEDLFELELPPGSSDIAASTSPFRAEDGVTSSGPQSHRAPPASSVLRHINSTAPAHRRAEEESLKADVFASNEVFVVRRPRPSLPHSSSPSSSSSSRRSSYVPYRPPVIPLRPDALDYESSPGTSASGSFNFTSSRRWSVQSSTATDLEHPSPAESSFNSPSFRQPQHSQQSPSLYSIGQIALTSSAVFVPLFLACFDADPCSVSTEDLLAFQSLVKSRDTAEKPRESLHPCIVAEDQKSPDLLPKVYLMTTLSSKTLAEVPDYMAPWAVPVNVTTLPSDPAGIDTVPPWKNAKNPSDQQWVIPFAFRPTHIQPRPHSPVVDAPNMRKIQSKCQGCTIGWRNRLALNSIPKGTSWRLIPKIANITSPAAIAVTSPTNDTTLTRGKAEEYFSHATSMFYHKGELAQINEQLKYHADCHAELTSQQEGQYLGTRDAFITYHYNRIKQLNDRATQAEYNMQGHRCFEAQLWPGLGIEASLEAALRLDGHQAPKVEATLMSVDAPTQANSPEAHFMVLSAAAFKAIPTADLLVKALSLPLVFQSEKGEEVEIDFQPAHNDCGRGRSLNRSSTHPMDSRTKQAWDAACAFLQRFN